MAAQIHCKYKCLSVRSPLRMHHPDVGPSTSDYKTAAKRPSSVRSQFQCHRSIFAYLIFFFAFYYIVATIYKTNEIINMLTFSSSIMITPCYLHVAFRIVFAMKKTTFCKINARDTFFLILAAVF